MSQVLLHYQWKKVKAAGKDGLVATATNAKLFANHEEREI